MQRDSFVFYRSFYEGIKELPRDIQGEVLTAIMEYGLNGVTTENLKPVAKAMFALIKPQLDANNQKFINGSNGGRPPKTETKAKPKQNQSKTKGEPNVNDNVNVNANVNANENGNVVFVPPTIFEVKQYFTEKGYTEESAQRAFDYYEAGNWADKDSKPVKNWKQKMISVWFKPENLKKQRRDAPITMF